MQDNGVNKKMEIWFTKFWELHIVNRVFSSNYLTQIHSDLVMYQNTKHHNTPKQIH